MSSSTTPNRTVDHSVNRPPSPAPGKGALLLTAPGAQVAAAGQRPASAAGTRHFIRHFAEMVLAMMVGMMALGGPERAILAATGTSAEDLRDSAPEAVALAMALNMSIGMTVWMLHRGHSWTMCAEMAGAMFVPAAAAIVLLWCGLIHSESVLGVEHAPMLPAMLAVMLFRRSEYSQPVHRRAQEAVGKSS